MRVRSATKESVTKGSECTPRPISKLFALARSRTVQTYEEVGVHSDLFVMHPARPQYRPANTRHRDII